MRNKKMSHNLEDVFKSLRMSALIQVRSCDVYPSGILVIAGDVAA